MFPLFRHVGANNTTPELCDCTKLILEELSSPSHNCNVFRFLSGFMFFNGVYAVSAGVGIALVVDKLKSDLRSLNANSHLAMFAASTFGQNSALSHELNSPESLEAAYDFCKMGTSSCTIITFATYDLVPTNWAVSEQYTLLQNGACSDSISPTAENW